MIFVKMKKTWTYWLDHDGNVQRTLPEGLIFELDVDTAAAAIAEGVADVTRGDSPRLAAAIERHKKLIENLAAGLSVEEAYARALEDEPPAPVVPVSAAGGPVARKAKLLKATEIDGERYAKGTFVEGELAAQLVAAGKAEAVAA